WIPPRWIDPQQRPIMNHRIIISNWDPNQPLDVNLPLDFDEPDLSDPDPPDPPDPAPDSLDSSS
ncbi:MAG TPA: HNH endonuclease, partial [Microlunatus sp.]|nr:HNH endonuclease [Microlunatus sp.]